MNPSIALSNPKEQCLTFFWDALPQHYVGYRFVEGQPVVIKQPITGYEKQPLAYSSDPPKRLGASQPHPNWKNDWLTAYSEQDSQAPVQLSFQLSSDGVAYICCVEKSGQQQRELYFQPFAYGVRIWAKLTTTESTEGSYCLQQCLRFTGMFNAEWRQTVAYTPFLSEFDMQAMGNPNGTLTYARRDAQWFSFPVQHMRYPTRGALATLSDPQSQPVDHGLIVRETPHRNFAPASYWDRVAPASTWAQIASGMYWERTAYISNRHPADCVHTWVDFGPLVAGQSRTLRGVVYFIEGSKDDLLTLWQSEFKSAG
jgi:hypothetical protein